MELLVAVLAMSAVAVLAAFVVARTERAHWFLALPPFTLMVFFLGQVPEVRDGGAVTTSYDWVPALGIELSLRLDGLGLLFAVLITGIGALVVLYTGAYLHGRPYLGRFYAILFLFMGSMLGLVLADDLVLFFVFWELTSISSYGLISIESERPASRAAAMQALLVTAGGGLALLAGFVLIGVVAGTQSIGEITATGQEVLRAHGYYEAIVVLVLLGAFTKSAQFPFHFWLPNAMEAPTPVSAYLHSATMVKAGVYLLARFTPALGGSDLWFYGLTIAGGTTMVLGALLALREDDLKRILAYVTVAILGSLVLLIGLGTEETIVAALVLLTAHALYKACLFLLAGIVDHEAGTRQVSRLGGLARQMPLTATCALLAAASMVGLPLWFGFIAKELSYEGLSHAPRLVLVATAAVVAANALMVAAAYVVAVRPFLGPKPAPVHAVPDGGHDHHVRDPGPAFLVGPIALAALCVLLGLIPGVADTLVGAAARATFGEPVDAHLAIWHGWNQPLLLSAATLALGLLTALVLAQVHAWLRKLTRALRPVSPERTYERLISGLNALATRQTRMLQSGYLRRYVATTFVVAVALVAVTLLARGHVDAPDTTSPVVAYEIVILALIGGGALLAVLARSRLTAAISLGMVGYGVALLYLVFGAPDLAMTQVLVETLAVLLFVFAFARLPRFASLSARATRARDALIAVGSGAMMTILLLTTLSTPRDQSLATLAAESSKPLAHGSNVVNVILVDFRALDTLGEITVLAVAAVGVLALFRRWARGGDD